MMVLSKAAIAPLVCISVAWSVHAGFAADRKPTRSECIVGYNLDWSQVSADRHEVRNSLSDRPTGNQRIDALAAMAISEDGTRLYLQFRDRCSRKQEMGANLIEFWRSERLDLPEFNIIQEPIIPSTKTIDVQGPDWRDGQPHGIRPDDLKGNPEKDRKI